MRNEALDVLTDSARAGALKHRMRQGNVVARVGGDGFAMLVPEIKALQP